MMERQSVPSKLKPGLLKFRMPAEKQHLDMIRRTISHFIKEYGFSRSKVAGLEVSIVEHCENIIKYGYAGKSGFIDVEVKAGLPKAAVTIKDTAPEFDMIKARAELPQLAERIKKGIGGKMGIRTILSMCDDVKYKRERGRNVNTFMINDGA